MSHTSPKYRPKESALFCILLASVFMAGCGGGSSANIPTTNIAETPASAVSILANTPTSPASDSTVEMGAALAAAVTATASATTTGCTPDGFGTFSKPFAAHSPWNSRPVDPVLGSATIPKSDYYPTVAAGPYSSTAFEAKATDGPVVITGNSTSGVWDPDSEVYRPSITIPHWPAGVVPATGSDGHAEIVDVTSGVVHSFSQLKQVDGVWKATQYAWTPLNGRGMGDPSHYFQGARAAGVSTLGGLIRKSEANDGASMFKHALAMSLTFNGLAANPTYVFPSTSSDTNAATANTGQIPMGSLMMLPASFNAQALATPELRKVAETLKTYGAYVVDRNYGTPYVIYVEIGADFKLHRNGWSNATANDLEVIRTALRPLQSAASWVDGADKPAAVTSTSLNLLSMRGYWYRSKGTQTGSFDTWRQALVFPATTTPIEQSNTGGRAYAGVKWAAPVAGDSYRLSVTATGGARLRTTITDKATNAVLYDSGDMSDAQTADFTWPAAASFKISTYAKSGVAGVESTVSAQLVKNDAPVIAQCGF